MYGSTSNNGSQKKIKRYYNNYKCRNNCQGQSYKSEVVHDVLHKELATIKPSENIKRLFRAILLDTYKDNIKDVEKNTKQIDKQILGIEDNQLKLAEKYISGKVDEAIYQKLLEKYRMDLAELKTEKAKHNNQDKDLEKFLSFGLHLLSNMDFYYKKSTVDVKVKLLGSYFTEKLIFENGKFRTLPFNEVIGLISKYTKIYKG